MKYITFKNVLIVGLVIVVIYLLTCNRPSYKLPVVTSVDSLKERVVHDTIESGRVRDSLQLVIDAKEKDARYWHNAFNVAANEAKSLEQSLTDYIANVSLPDTCKSFRDFIEREYAKLKEANRQKDLACNNTISAKNTIIANKDKQISNSQKEKKKILAVLDTALKNQATLEAAVKHFKPKREVFVGITALSSYQNIQPTVGVSLGLKTRNGYYFEAGINLRKEINISIKRNILKF